MHVDGSSVVSRRQLLAGAGLAAASVATVGRVVPALATPATDALEAAITEAMGAGAILGAAVLVERPDLPTWARGFGVSDLRTGAPMTPDLHLRIGSITKTMTATLVLQLVDEGALALDDTLALVLPAGAGIPDADAITVRHLLAMRSGVFDYVEDESFFPQVIADPVRSWTPVELIAIAAGQGSYAAPGEMFRYSNTNYILLGMIVERHDGTSFQDALARRILDPLGMTRTSLPVDAALPAPFARGYAFDPESARTPGATPDGRQVATPAAAAGLVDVTELSPSIAWTAGGIVSTVGDLRIWLRALVDGDLVSAGLQRERLAFGQIAPDLPATEIGYGLGVFTVGGMIGHDGSIPGYQSFAGHDPGTGETVIVLVNVEPTREGTVAASAIVDAILGVAGEDPAAAR